LALIWGISLLIVGCSDESPTDHGNGPIDDRYRLESEPARSPDGQYVYYIATDTVDTSRSGLWRAKIVKPVREELLNGIGFSSPSASPNGNVVAFLDSSRIAYFRISDGQRWESTLQDSYAALVWLNDEKLIGQRSDSLFLLSEPDSSEQFVAVGSDPVLVAVDTFTYVVPVMGYAFGIVKSGLPELESDTVYYVSVDSSSGTIRWPNLESGSGQLAWTLAYTNSFSIWTGRVPFSEPVQIDATLTSKSCILNEFLLIFTGPDGRFYKSDFDGSGSWPFWHSEDGN
jgi:hypothetical protein